MKENVRHLRTTNVHISQTDELMFIALLRFQIVTPLGRQHPSDAGDTDCHVASLLAMTS